MWPTLYIAQSCAFNAWSCYIYIFWSCDLYRPILWPFSSSFVPNIHRPNLWTLSPDLVTYTRNVVSCNTRSCGFYHRSLVTSIAQFLTYIRYIALILIGFVTYIAQSCDLYRPILWPLLRKFPHAYWLMMSDLVTFKSA